MSTYTSNSDDSNPDLTEVDPDFVPSRKLLPINPDHKPVTRSQNKKR